MGEFIYRLKKDVDLNKLGELGWDIAPCQNGMIFMKYSVQPLDSDLPNQLLNAYYKNPFWIEKFYKKNKKRFKEKIDLRYDRKGNIMKSKHFEKTLTHWVIEIEEYEEGWICISPYDDFCKNSFYGKQVLDKYCTEDIKKLKEADLIEEFEVEG